MGDKHDNPSEQLERVKAAAVHQPVCPHCGTDPATIGSVPFQMNPRVMAVAFFCGTPHCRKLFSIQIVEVDKPRVQVADGRLVS